MALTRKQLEGLRHCPDRRVSEAVATALAALQARDDAERRVQDLQDRIVLKENEYRILVILHKDGRVELWSKQWMPVKFAHWPDVGADEAEEYMRSRLPLQFKELYDVDGKKIGVDSCKSCLSRGELRHVQSQLAEIQLWRDIEKELEGMDP